MVTLTFDTLKASKDLKAAGFDELQAEALVATVGDALVGSVATKSDIAELRNDYELSTHELKGDITELRAELKGDTAESRAEYKGDIAELRGELAELRSEVNVIKADVATLRAEVGELRGEVGSLRGEIAGLRSYTDVAISEVREDMRALELRMTLRLGGIVVASVGLGVAAMQLFG